MTTLGSRPSRYATPARKRSTRLPLLSFRRCRRSRPSHPCGSRPGMYSVVASAAPVRPSKMREVLGPGEDLAVARVAGGRHLHAVGRHRRASDSPSRIADHPALAVDGAVGGLARHFGAAVAVEVVDDELRVVRAGADVPAEIDAPEARAVELVGVEDDRPDSPAEAVSREFDGSHLTTISYSPSPSRIGDGRVVCVVGVFADGTPAGTDTSPPAGRCSGTVRYCCTGALAGSVNGALAACSTPPTTGRTT